MELEKGPCFFCCNTKVIGTTREVKEAYQIISSLFSRKILNVAEFDNIKSSLKLCPICYHKLLILKSIGNNIATGNSEEHISKDNCFLCESGKNLFKVIDWQRFDKATEDFAAKESDQYIVCSDCLFYLDGRYDVKTKLLLEYPQVEVNPQLQEEPEVQAKPQNKITVKKKQHVRNTRLSNGITAHSTPISENKRTLRKKPPTDIINISDDEDPSKKKGFNFDSLKGLKPLKNDKIFRGRKIVKDDSRFLNQIPYVLLKTSNAGNDKNLSKVNRKIAPTMTVQIESNKVITAKFKAADSTEQKGNQNKKNKRLSSRSMIIKRTLNKHVIVKDLSVKLLRINLAQKRFLKLSRSYLGNDLIVEQLNEKSDLEDSVVSNKTGVIETSISDDLNTSRDTSVKTKRKSVSFAEDKNVEIDYSPIRPKIISRRASTIGNVREKLSFDEPVPEKSDEIANSDGENEISKASEKPANTKNAARSESDAKNESYGTDKLLDGSNKELDSSTENNEEVGKENAGNKSNFDTPQKKTVRKIPESSDEEAVKPPKDVVEEPTSGKKKTIPKKNRPGPLSKKRKANVGNQSSKAPKDSDISENAERDSPILSKPKESVDSENSSSNKREESDQNDSDKNDGTEEGKELLDDNENVGTGEKVKEDETNEDENCRTPKKSAADLDAEIDKIDDEDSSSSRSSENEKSKQSSIRSKPGPLSKKKKALKVDDAKLKDVDRSVEKDNDSVKVPKEIQTESSEVGSSQTKDEQEKADENEPVDDSDTTDDEFKPIDRNLDDENKESDEEAAGGSKTDSESPAAVDKDESNSFSDNEKNDELRIMEEDKDNIESILSSFELEEDLPQAETSNKKDQQESEKFEDAEDSDVNRGSKRKLIDDESNSSMDKKRKKVTFCEDAT